MSSWKQVAAAVVMLEECGVFGKCGLSREIYTFKFIELLEMIDLKTTKSTSECQKVRAHECFVTHGSRHGSSVVPQLITLSVRVACRYANLARDRPHTYEPVANCR
jgi:hypothetical protein